MGKEKIDLMNPKVDFVFKCIFGNEKQHYLRSRKKGSLAEWLGTGLQNRLQQFESARNLSKPKPSVLKQGALLYCSNKPYITSQ